MKSLVVLLETKDAQSRREDEERAERDRKQDQRGKVLA
jgi:hypothetical protein